MREIVLVVATTICAYLAKIIAIATVILSITNLVYMLVKDTLFMEWHSLLVLAVWGIVLGVGAMVMAIILVVNHE